MSYATQADLETRFGSVELAQLSDRTNGSVIDATVVARAIADAEAEIDGWLGRRYQLPLATVPAVLGLIACDLARYYLYDDKATDAVQKRYDDGVKRLKAIAAGDVVLDGVTPPTSASSGIAVTSRAPDRIFNADSLAGY